MLCPFHSITQAPTVKLPMASHVCQYDVHESCANVLQPWGLKRNGEIDILQPIHTCDHRHTYWEGCHGLADTPRSLLYLPLGLMASLPSYLAMAQMIRDFQVVLERMSQQQRLNLLAMATSSGSSDGSIGAGLETYFTHTTVQTRDGNTILSSGYYRQIIMVRFQGI